MKYGETKEKISTPVRKKDKLIFLISPALFSFPSFLDFDSSSISVPFEKSET